MSSNVKKCSACNSTSMEHCLKIKCKYWAAGSHLNDNKTRRKRKSGRSNSNNWYGKNKS
nr:MAG TPA: hypothetical protein [Caudoviricetes sp.]